MKKRIHALNVEFTYLWVTETKIKSFEITVIIFKRYKISKYPIQKRFLKWITCNQYIHFPLL